MSTVVGQVQQIVQEVDAGCAQAKGYKGEKSSKQGVNIMITVLGKHWHEDEHIFSPLMRTHLAHEFAPDRGFGGNAVCQLALDSAYLMSALSERT